MVTCLPYPHQAASTPTSHTHAPKLNTLTLNLSVDEVGNLQQCVYMYVLDWVHPNLNPI